MLTKKEDRSFSLMWSFCEPFSNATVKRMLTVAHGAFCLMDIGEATVRGFTSGSGNFNLVAFFMRLNIVGIGRFSVSLYGEVRRGIRKLDIKDNMFFLTRKKLLIEDYIVGLSFLSEIYNDQLLLTFIEDLRDSKAYKQAFEKSAILAVRRNVPENEILKTKTDIDQYFRKGK